MVGHSGFAVATCTNIRPIAARSRGVSCSPPQSGLNTAAVLKAALLGRFGHQLYKPEHTSSKNARLAAPHGHRFGSTRFHRNACNRCPVNVARASSESIGSGVAVAAGGVVPVTRVVLGIGATFTLYIAGFGRYNRRRIAIARWELALNQNKLTQTPERG